MKEIVVGFITLFGLLPTSWAQEPLSAIDKYGNLKFPEVKTNFEKGWEIGWKD